MSRYKKIIGSKKKRYGDFLNDSLNNAVESVKQGMTIRAAANQYNIPKSTLHRKCRKKQMKTPGGQLCLTIEEENVIVKHLIVVGDWGFPFSRLDLRLLVKSYLDRSNRTVKRFKENLPGDEWAKSFIKRHAKDIQPQLCQNIKTTRAEMSREELIKYFDNLKDVLDDVPCENILSYDETNLSDNPGQEKLIFKRGKKYPERIMNYTKGSTSIMFS